MGKLALSGEPVKRYRLHHSAVNITLKNQGLPSLYTICIIIYIIQRGISIYCIVYIMQYPVYSILCTYVCIYIYIYIYVYIYIYICTYIYIYVYIYIYIDREREREI